MLAKITMPKLWHNYDMTMPSAYAVPQRIFGTWALWRCTRRTLTRPRPCWSVHLLPSRRMIQRLGSTGKHWEALGSTGKPWPLKQTEDIWRLKWFQDVSRCFKMFQDVSRCFKMFQIVSRCFKMFQDVSRCFKMFQRPFISEIWWWCWNMLNWTPRGATLRFRWIPPECWLCPLGPWHPGTTCNNHQNDHQNDHQNHKTSADPTGRRDHC